MTKLHLQNKINLTKYSKCVIRLEYRIRYLGYTQKYSGGRFHHTSYVITKLSKELEKLGYSLDPYTKKVLEGMPEKRLAVDINMGNGVMVNVQAKDEYSFSYGKCKIK